MPENENLAYWSQLQETDPRYTKQFTRGGGFKGTDINPTWRFKRMTEVFGPCGLGWGWSIDQPLFRTVGDKEVVFVGVSVWWRPQPDPKSEQFHTGIQYGGTELSGRTPDEALKMAVTDGLGKCMNALGLAADIYMGLFDDSKYREALEEKAKTQPAPATQIKKPTLADWRERVIAEIRQLANPKALAGYAQTALKAGLEVADKEDKAIANEVRAAFYARQADLGVITEQQREQKVAALEAKEAA